MQPLLERLPFALGEYFERLGVNAEKFQAYISRCWPAYQTVGQEIHLHRHMQSNISGVYYVDVPPEKSGTFSFYFYDVACEFIPGLFSSDAHAKKGLLKSWNLMRATEVPLVMETDQLIYSPLRRSTESTPAKTTTGQGSLLPLT